MAALASIFSSCGERNVSSGSYRYSNAEQMAVLTIADTGTFEQVVSRRSGGQTTVIQGKWQKDGNRIIFRPFLMPIDVDTGGPLGSPKTLSVAYGQLSGEIITINPDYGYNYKLE